MTDHNCVQCSQSRAASSSASRAASRRRERRRRRAATSGGRSSSRRSRSSHRSRSGGGRRQQGTGGRQSSHRSRSPGRHRHRAGRHQSGSLSAEEEARAGQIQVWQHGQSFLFASLGVVLGMFSLNRFVILTLDFGAAFVVQFLLLSLCFGIPLLTFFISCGQYLGSGLIDMWRISPIFQGVGVSLMLVQGMVGVNSLVVTSWMLVYFRDSFETMMGSYSWTKCQKSVPSFSELRRCGNDNSMNSSIEQTIPDYFAASVLQRTLPIYPPSFETWFGSLKYQVVFNLVVAWLVVFICLSKGVRSYGKAVYFFGPVPLICYAIFATKVLGLFPLQSFQDWLYDQDWSSYIYNAKSWVCAAKECFLTWSFLGGSLLQLAAHNKFRHNLKRDSTIIILITLIFLVVSGILGVAIHKLIETSGQYTYIPSSFETYESWQFLNNREYDKINSNVFHRPENGRSTGLKAVSSPSEYDHVSYLAGVRIISPTADPVSMSGYQVHRLATELVPAYFAILGPKIISPFWCVLFYLTLIMLGIGQCLALFHTVIQGIVAIKPTGLKSLKSSEGVITFAVCLFGFILGLPAATEIGIFVVYFVDTGLGSGWWVMVLYLALLFAVMVVRGKPYGAEQIVTVLFPKRACCSAWLGPLLAFTWNVVLPIALLIMAVVTFKTGMVAEMFNWSQTGGYIYLPSWVREIGSMMQVMPLLVIPFVGIIQSCRYFLHGPDNLLERLEMLYRPSYSRQGLSTVTRQSRASEVVLTNFTPTSGSASSSSGGQGAASSDPPPKYTPPPSYSTATGARLARMLSQSFRRSVRRLQGAAGGGQEPRSEAKHSALPPDYAHVVIESTRGQAAARSPHSDPDVYAEPHDAIIFEMRPTGNIFNTELGAYSLDLSLPTLQRRSVRRNNSSDRQQQQHQEEPPGQLLAVGVGSLHRADSEAVLMDDAEPMNIDSVSEVSLDLGEVIEDRVMEDTSDTGERLRSSAEMEAVNFHVRQSSLPSPSESLHVRQSSLPAQQGVTIDMDMSTSVI